jgi:hypothetical protein
MEEWWSAIQQIVASGVGLWCYKDPAMKEESGTAASSSWSEAKNSKNRIVGRCVYASFRCEKETEGQKWRRPSPCGESEQLILLMRAMHA